MYMTCATHSLVYIGASGRGEVTLQGIRMIGVVVRILKAEGAT
jgi:hypothetical protein